MTESRRDRVRSRWRIFPDWHPIVSCPGSEAFVDWAGLVPQRGLP